MTSKSTHLPVNAAQLAACRFAHCWHAHGKRWICCVTVEEAEAYAFGAGRLRWFRDATR